MATTTPKEQTEQSVEKATQQKGSQRIDAFAMVDKDSWVSFKVPEWFATICKNAKPNGASTGATQWKPKPSTKAAKTADESLDAETTGAGGNRNVRKELEGVPDDTTRTKFIGIPVKLYISATAKNVKKNTQLLRGDKPYKHRTIRVHQAMNAMAIKYFIQEVVTDDAVTAFSVGKTKYFMGEPKVELADLGSLRDKEGATTAP